MSDQAQNSVWLEELQMLAPRFSWLGIQADMAAFSLYELWGLYCYLQKLAV